MSGLLSIEIQRAPAGGWRVWHGTWATDRWSRAFEDPREAEAFALERFRRMPSRSLLYPRDWPLERS